jgi:hypothetical protein
LVLVVDRDPLEASYSREGCCYRSAELGFCGPMSEFSRRRCWCRGKVGDILRGMDFDYPCMMIYNNDLRRLGNNQGAPHLSTATSTDRADDMMFTSTVS